MSDVHLKTCPMDDTACALERCASGCCLAPDAKVDARAALTLTDFSFGADIAGPPVHRFFVALSYPGRPEPDAYLIAAHDKADALAVACRYFEVNRADVAVTVQQAAGSAAPGLSHGTAIRIDTTVDTPP